MKSLIWKEWRENFKWVALPILPFLGLMALFGTPPLMNAGVLFFVSLIAAVFGAGLGFLQIFFESSGDKRSLLLHRPLSRSQIFLGKVLAGVGLYLLGLGIPFACGVGLAATPGHIDQPFVWPMAFPWLADSLTGLVYYFAGMLTAQREARWYGSRCLGLAAGLFCSIVVWTLPEFWHALLAIGIVGGVVAVAAWGSFSAGGAYPPQPRLAKIALAVTFLIGLSVLSFTGKLFTGIWLERKTEYESLLDPQGRVLLRHQEDGKIQSVIDLEGNEPQDFKGKQLNRYELIRQIRSPLAHGGAPKTRSYRNLLVHYKNETVPDGEAWWYVPPRGRLLGYDEKSKRFLGSFGPDGFVPPDEQPRERFQGELACLSGLGISRADEYLAFPGGVYAVDFRTRKVQTLFAPAAGEIVLWASKWTSEKPKLTLAFVGTDHAVLAMNEAGSRVLVAPLAYERQSYRVRDVGRLENPERYWVWYEPAWYLGVGTLETLADFVVIYDRAGREIQPRQKVPPRPGGARNIRPPSHVIEPSYTQAWSGLVTPPAEAAILVGTTQYLESGVRASNGTEAPLLLRLILNTTQFFLPGVRWDPHAHAGLVFGFGALMLVSAVVGALLCFLLSYHFSFCRARCIGWTLCGLLFGPTGVLLMIALLEWPAQIACPKCGRLRVVTRDTCEHCGAAHAVPVPDGTEIFEQTAASPQPAMAIR